MDYSLKLALINRPFWKLDSLPFLPLTQQMLTCPMGGGHYDCEILQTYPNISQGFHHRVTVGGPRKPVRGGNVCTEPWALGPGPYKLFGKNVNLGI